MKHFLFLYVTVALFLHGCGCNIPHSPQSPLRPSGGGGDSSKAAGKITTGGVSPGAGADNRLSRLFSLKAKIEEVRYLYEHGQETFAARQAENLFPQIQPDSREAMELHFLAARCYQRLNQHFNRKRHDEQFRRILNKLRKSKVMDRAREDAYNIRALVERSIELGSAGAVKGRPDSDDEEFFNVRCYRRLKRVSKGQVIHENLDSGGSIYYGFNVDRVRKQAAAGQGVDELDVVIQRDPRFLFYYSIIETGP